jgi:hypothetical protein
MISAEKLREVIMYDADSGVFTWVNRRSNVKAGQKCGTALDRGYVGIRLFGRRYYAHRLAWLYVYGAFPTNVIDHINGCKNDNRIENLREVTQAQNLQNVLSPKRNALGHTGVYRHKSGRYRCSISINGVCHSLGCYETLALASEAREFAKELFHPFAPSRTIDEAIALVTRGKP